MTVDARLKQLAAVVCLMVLAGTANATENTLDLTLPAGKYYSADASSFLLAENDAAESKAKNTIMAVTPAAEFEPKLITGKKVHEYMGLGTLILAGLTMITAPEGDCEHNSIMPIRRVP